MASRPTFKHQSSFGPGEHAYEMKPIGGETHVKPVQDGDFDDNQEETEKGATAIDRKDMYRLNKAQELRRNFRFLSIVGYSVILGDTWVLALIGAIAPLSNGGTAGGIWMFLIVITGMTFSTLSMAELASMAPTAGKYLINGIFVHV